MATIQEQDLERLIDVLVTKEGRKVAIYYAVEGGVTKNPDHIKQAKEYEIKESENNFYKSVSKVYEALYKFLDSINPYMRREDIQQCDNLAYEIYEKSLNAAKKARGVAIKGDVFIEMPSSVIILSHIDTMIKSLQNTVSAVYVLIEDLIYAYEIEGDFAMAAELALRKKEESRAKVYRTLSALVE